MQLQNEPISGCVPAITITIQKKLMSSLSVDVFSLFLKSAIKVGNLCFYLIMIIFKLHSEEEENISKIRN